MSVKKYNYEQNEVFIYQNGDDHFELGIIKRRHPTNSHSYFAYFHMGDTAAMVSEDVMHKISNNYAFKITRLTFEDN